MGRSATPWLLVVARRAVDACIDDPHGGDAIIPAARLAELRGAVKEAEDARDMLYSMPALTGGIRRRKGRGK